MNDNRLDQLNRFIIVVAAICLIFSALLVVLLAWGASASTIGRIEDFAGFLRRHDHNEERLVVTMAAIVVVLLMAIVIIIEATPSAIQSMRVRNVKAGAAAITTKQIADRINAEVAQVEHVASCIAAVAARGKNVEVVLDLYVDHAADLAATAEAACRRAQQLVETQLGVGLAKRPSALLHYRELRLGSERPGGRSEQPASRAAAAAHTGWERPGDRAPGAVEGERDQRGSADAPEEATQT